MVYAANVVFARLYDALGRRAGGLRPGGLIYSQAVVMRRLVIFAGIGSENFLVIWEFQAVNRALRMNPPGG